MELRCPNCKAPVSADERSCRNCGVAYSIEDAPGGTPSPGTAPSPPPTLQPQVSSVAPRRRALPALSAAFAVIVLIGGLGAWLALRDGSAPAGYPPNEVYLVPAGGVENAFTPSLLTSRAIAALPGPATTLIPAAPGDAVHVKGSDELNYAGARDAHGCDVSALLTHLNNVPSVAEAWAHAQGIEPDEVSNFAAGLTAVVLTQDVRVTSHALDAGKAVPRQAVLEKGTAVLAGPTGEPRVRCASGSPLGLPVAPATPTYVGVAWPAFDPLDVVEIDPCEEPIAQFILQDLATGAAFARPIGWGFIGDFDIVSPTTTTTSTTVAPTTTSTTSTTTTTLPVADYNATREGTVSASSRLCGSFAAAKAADGDVTTSWISSSGDGAYSTFEWTAPGLEFVGSVGVVSNAQNATSRRRTGHGFAAVTIQVLDESGGVVYEERVELPGTPDPDVLVEPNVEGRSVRLLLEGHENSSGSGFSELTVMVAR